MRICRMRPGVTVHLSPTDRKRLQAIVDDRNSLQKHVWRARIVLGTADGLGTVEIMRTAGVSKPAIWRWQARFMEEGVEGLRRDKTPGTPRLPQDVADRVVDLTLGDPPAHAVVLSVDEKSQIQALDRTQPGLPLKKGRAGTMT